MKKHNKTAMAMSAAVLTLVLMGTACSNNNQVVNSTPSASSTVSASPTASGNPDAETASPSASPELLTGTGEYVGLQDSHTIEITTEEGPAAFQVSPEIAEKIGGWEDGTPVKFQYTSLVLDAGGEQNTIVSIDKQ